jgi:elongation factor P
MALSYTELTKGALFVYEGAPYEVLESHFLRMQQRKAVNQTKIKNLITGKILDRNWQSSDVFEEAEVDRKKAIFIYKSKDECWFHEESDKAKRFSLKEEVLGDAAQFLKANTPVTTFVWNEKVIAVEPPIKMTLEVTEAPPATKGNTAQGGTKVVTLETGATVSAPLFIEAGEKVIVNTQTGEYVERA